MFTVKRIDLALNKIHPTELPTLTLIIKRYNLTAAQQRKLYRAQPAQCVIKLDYDTLLFVESKTSLTKCQ